MTAGARFLLAAVLVLLALAALAPGAAHAECQEAKGDELGFQSSGKLLIGLCAPQGQAAVLRLDQAGRLDPSFADDGSLGPWPEPGPPHLAVTPSGKLLVQMRLGAERGAQRLVLRRFSVDGALDGSFGGGDGSVLVPTNKEHSQPAGEIRVFSQPGGKSVVGYYGSDSGCIESFCSERTYFLRLFRYSPTGKLIDSAWYYTEYWDLRGLTMAPDGGFIVTGSATEYGIDTYLRTWPNLKTRVHRDFHEGRGPGRAPAAGPGGTFWALGEIGRATRYRLHGSVDRSIGEGGLSAACPSATSAFGAIQRLPMGGFLAAGGRCGVAEYRADGSLDPGFGDGGVVDLWGMGLIPRRYGLRSVAVGPQGQVALAFRNYDRPLVRIIRLSASGALDRRFGDDGVVTLRGFGLLESVS
jgi:uncharacterized delta-60 repeat protein